MRGLLDTPLRCTQTLSHVEIFCCEILVIKDLKNGGNPTSHTPALNVPAVAASFRI